MPNIIKNTSALLVAHLISSVIAFGLLFLLPRYFPKEELGGYLWAVAFTNMMSIFIKLGMQSPLIRGMVLAPAKTQSYVSNALFIRMLLSLIAFTAMVGIAKLLDTSSQTMFMVYILGLSEILNSITHLFWCVFRAREEMKFEAIAVITQRALVLLIGGGLVIRGCELLTFCKIILSASLINLCLCFVITTRRFTKLSLKLESDVWKNLLVQALPFALGGIFNLSYFRAASVMLPKLSSYHETAVAWYGLAYGVISPTILIPGAFMAAVFPAMSRAVGEQRSDLSAMLKTSLSKTADSNFQRLYTHSLRLMFILALPIAVGISLLTKEIAGLWPSEYQPMSEALSILSWAGGLIFINTVLQTVLRAADKRTAFTTLMATRLLFSIVLNIILIPRWHHKGAAIAMVITELYLSIVGFGYVSKNLAKPDRFGFVPKSVIASLGMGILLFLLRGKIPIFLLIPIAGPCYLAVMVLWKELRWREIIKLR